MKKFLYLLVLLPFFSGALLFSMQIDDSEEQGDAQEVMVDPHNYEIGRTSDFVVSLQKDIQELKIYDRASQDLLLTLDNVEMFTLNSANILRVFFKDGEGRQDTKNIDLKEL